MYMCIESQTQTSNRARYSGQKTASKHLRAAGRLQARPLDRVLREPQRKPKDLSSGKGVPREGVPASFETRS